MKFARNLAILALSTGLFFGFAPSVSAADDNTPCPVIRGVQTFSTIAGAKCNFPSGSFPAGSASGNAAQSELNAWNIQHRTTSASGVTSGNQGATQINGAGAMTPEQIAAANGANSGQAGGSGECNYSIDLYSIRKSICEFSNFLFSMEFIYWLLGIGSWFFFRLAQVTLAYATYFLDGSVYFLVLKMGQFISSYQANGIREAWAMIRDLVNLAIIAGFIAVGISTILQIGQYAADKFLSKLIIAALLVNFSYFFAGVVIDASNYLAVQVYESNFIQSVCTEKTGISGGTLKALETVGGAIVTRRDYPTAQEMCSISKSFVKKTKIDSWDNIECMARKRAGAGECTTNAAGQTSTPTSAGSWRTSTEGLSSAKRADLFFELFIIALMGGIFLWVTATVFLAAAYMFVVRFAALIILLVVSPIGIAGINIPYVDRYAGRWWDAIISQAAFAPFFFILIAISLRVIDGMISIFNNGGASYAGSVNGSAVNTGYIEGNLALFITYFVGIAFMFLSLQMAKQMADSVPELKGFYDQAVTFANRAKWAPTRGLQMLVGKPTEAGLDQLGKIPYLGRAFTTLSVGLNKLNNIGSGKKPKEGDKGAWAQKWEERNAYKANAGLRDNERAVFGSWMTRSVTGKPGYAGIVAKMRAGGELTPEEIRQWNMYQNSKKGTELMQELGADGVAAAAKAGHLDPAKLKEINESLEVSKTDRSKVNDGYFAKFNELYNNGGWTEAAAEFENMSDTEREILLAERTEIHQNKDFLAALKSDTFKGLLKGRSTAEQGEMKQKRSGALSSSLKSGTTEERQKTLSRMSNDEKADLDAETVEKLLEDESLSPAEIKHLWENNKKAGVSGENGVLMKNGRARRVIEMGGTGMKKKDDGGGTGGNTPKPEEPKQEPAKPQEPPKPDGSTGSDFIDNSDFQTYK